MLKKMLFVTILSLELTTAAAAAPDIVELALGEVGTGSADEMRIRIFSIPITVLDSESCRGAMKALPDSIRDHRITEGKLLRRVERIIKPVLQLHRRMNMDKVELFLYRDDLPKGMLWMGCMLILSDSLADLLYDAELTGVVVHELAHSYFADEMVAAQRTKDDRAMRLVELKCDAVAVLSLKLLGSNPAHHFRGLQRIMTMLGQGVGSWKKADKTHPSIVERALFSQRFVKLLA